MRIVCRAWIYGFITETILVLAGLAAVMSGGWGSAGFSEPSGIFTHVLYWIVLFFHLPSFALWFLWDFLGSDWAPLFYAYLLAVFLLQSFFFSILWNIWVTRKNKELEYDDEFTG